MVNNHKKELAGKIGQNIVFFALSKGTAFLAPLLFLNIVSLEEYGIVEYSYSMGSMIAMFVLLGFTGAYPYFILKRKELDKEEAFLFYGVPVLIIAVLNYILYRLELISSQIHIVLLFTLIFSLQRLYSTILKSNDKGHLGVLMDGGYYFILGSIVIFAWIFNLPHPITCLEQLMNLYLLALGLFFLWKFYKKHTKTISQILTKDYPEILHFSIKMALSGLIIYWLTSSSRIYIQHFMGYEKVGIYSFYFRLTGISVVLFQFIYIAFFKHLYLANGKRLDNYYSMIMGIILCGCLSVLLLFPFLFQSFFKETVPNDTTLFLLLSLQMPIWVGIALCEGIIGRENLVNKMNLVIGICVLTLPLLLYLNHKTLTLHLFTLFNALILSAAFFGQIYILYRTNIKLKKCSILNGVLLTASILTYLYI